tara:strand:- start:617 stop:781 length:165 start_codon:yes stop_codon:yes gene_type:complete
MVSITDSGGNIGRFSWYNTENTKYWGWIKFNPIIVNWTNVLKEDYMKSYVSINE